MQLHVGDNFWITSHSKEDLEQTFRASLWWTSTYNSEEKVDMNLGTTSGCYKFHLEERFKILGCAIIDKGKRTMPLKGECSQQTRLSGRTF